MATDWRQFLKLGNGSFAMQTMLSQLEVARRKGKVAWNSEDTIGADVPSYARGKIARIPYDARSFGMGDVGTEDEDKVILGSLYDQAPVQVARKIGGVDYTRTKAEVKSDGGGTVGTITKTLRSSFYYDDMVTPKTTADIQIKYNGGDIPFTLLVESKIALTAESTPNGSIGSLQLNSTDVNFLLDGDNSINFADVTSPYIDPIKVAIGKAYPLTFTWTVSAGAVSTATVITLVVRLMTNVTIPSQTGINWSVVWGRTNFGTPASPNMLCAATFNGSFIKTGHTWHLRQAGAFSSVNCKWTLADP